MSIPKFIDQDADVSNTVSYSMISSM